jgi:hypothetical protein
MADIVGSADVAIRNKGQKRWKDMGDGTWAEVMYAAGSSAVTTAAATPTQASVASSGSSVTLLAASSTRLGATIYNDSTQILYLKLGATASTSSYTIQIAANGYYEVPFYYTGVIDGIWASANGNARITSLAA